MPFTKTEKRPLNSHEATLVERVRGTVLIARNSLVGRPPDGWKPSDRHDLLSRTTEVALAEDELALVVELLQRILAEFTSELALRPFLVPGIRRSDFESLLRRASAPS